MPCLKEPMSREQVKRVLQLQRQGKRQRGRKESQGYYCERCKAYHLTTNKNWFDGGVIVKRKYAKHKRSSLTSE